MKYLIVLLLFSISITLVSSASSCSYYSYSSSDNLCCVSRNTPSYSYYYYYTRSYYSSYYYYYYTYCPTTSTLDTICGSSCCNASVPVYANSDVFYYSTYHCPSTSYYNYYNYYNYYYYNYNNYYVTYCGGFCIMAIVFGLFGSCFCICGIAFSIAFCVLVHIMANKKKTPVNPTCTNVAGATPVSGLQDSSVAMKQQFKQETLPPQIPGYTYNPNPTNTGGATPYPNLMDTAVNLPPNPLYNQMPQVVTDETAQPLLPQYNIQLSHATNLAPVETSI